MFLFKKAFALVDTLVDRIVCVAGAILFSQLPMLIYQYKLVLNGALQEARLNIKAYEEQALSMGLKLEQWMNALLNNSDPPVQGAGIVMKKAIERAANYEEAYKALDQASMFSKPFVFLKVMDRELLAGAWRDFHAGVPLTAESALYALAGMLIALLLYKMIVHLPFYLMRSKKKGSA